jgi:hypothetical protein
VILEAVAAVTTACKALEMAAGAANNIESLGAFIGRMGAAEFDLQRAKNTVRSMSEAEAAKAVMAEEMVRQSRENMKSVFLATNRMDLWDDMQKKMAEARRARQEEIKRQELAAKKRKKQIIEVLIVLAIALGLVPVAIALVVWWATS